MDSYIHRMRRDPYLGSAEFVFFVERNHCGVKANDICNWVQGRYMPCTIVADTPKRIGDPGVWCGPGDKERFIPVLNWFLGKGDLKIYRNFHTSYDTAKELLPQLQSQLQHYRRKLQTVTDASLKEAVTSVWSGKDKSGNMKDDMAISLMQGVWHAVGFMADANMTYPYQPMHVRGLSYASHNRTYVRARVVG